MITQIPVRTDNYIYILQQESSNEVIVIDPAEHQPVLSLCAQNNWRVSDILITHHHPDHIHGVSKIVETFGCSTWGLAADQHRLPHLNHALPHSSSQQIRSFPIFCQYTPGHTLGHISYYLPQHQILFCGDTLFSMGCGRLFEGTPAMMLESLKWIRSLPDNTTVYCSHEYTLTNTEFALSIDPHNLELQEFYKQVVKLRSQNQPTVPMSLKTEKRLNPFLRWDDPHLLQQLTLNAATPLEVLTLIRKKRDRW